MQLPVLSLGVLEGTGLPLVGRGLVTSCVLLLVGSGEVVAGVDVEEVWLSDGDGEGGSDGVRRKHVIIQV